MLDRLREQTRSLRGSVVRAGIFTVAWAVLPYWLFIIVAFLLFLIPPSEAKRVIVPFIVLLGLGAFTPVGFSMAVIFGLLFWYILLIKELYLVDRRMAYEILALGLTFFSFRLFYGRMGDGFAGIAPIFFALLAAIAAGALFSSFLGAFSEVQEPRAAMLLRRVSGFGVFFVAFEVLLAGLFLPLDAVYQASVAFLLMVPVMDFAGRHLSRQGLDRTRVLVVSSTVFAGLVLILGAVPWSL